MYLSATGTAYGISEPIIGRVTTVPLGDRNARGDHIACICADNRASFGQDFVKYAGLFIANHFPHAALPELPYVVDCPNLGYVTDGDVLMMSPSGTVRVLYRKASAYNAILVTERCNSLCLMCSQPPKAHDDVYKVQYLLRLIEMIDPSAREIGITGGEPTLLGDDFLAIIRKLKDCLPNTSVHVLSNGRRFEDRHFAERLGEIGHPDLMVGIPVYSCIDDEHDYVVQKGGAFDETILGLYNLAACEVPVEIRVVVHKLTYRRLPQLAEYVYRNFPFAAHVALMGMEMYGYANLNYPCLWIDPVDYMPQLEQATLTLALHGMNVSIYNHQLCTVPRKLWPFTRRSISDWKNVYMPECQGCRLRSVCGGFFQSATKRHSAHIAPVRDLDESTLERLSKYVCRASE